jgi:hypothetical protein
MDNTLQSLKPGQIFKGTILQFFPEHMALINLGGQRMYARLEAPLVANREYWFTVVPNKGIVELKVVDENQSSIAPNFQSASKKFLNSLGLPQNKNALALMQSLSDNHIPFTRENIMTITGWLGTMKSPHAQTVIELMLKRDLPLTKQVFESLLAFQEAKPIIDQLQNIYHALSSRKIPLSSATEELKVFLQVLLVNGTNESTQSPAGSVQSSSLKSEDIGTALKRVYDLLGLNHENSLLKSDHNPLQSIKSLLIKAMEDTNLPNRLRDQLGTLLQTITGQQLLNEEQRGSIQHYMMQIPFQIGSEKNDVTLQWKGKKTKRGEIDPDFCRILLFLELKVLKEIVIDVQIQNRVITIEMMNDHPFAGTLLSTFKPKLKDGLESLNYHLSAIRLSSSSKRNVENSATSARRNVGNVSYTGVDYRI